MATIHNLPSLTAPRRAASGFPRTGGHAGVRSPDSTAAMVEIARRLYIDDDARPTIISKIRRLNESYGFPDPVNPRFWSGQLQKGPDAIVWKSLFDRAEIEAWFDHHHRPSQFNEITQASARKAVGHQLARNGLALVAQMKAERTAA